MSNLDPDSDLRSFRTQIEDIEDFGNEVLRNIRIYVSKDNKKLLKDIMNDLTMRLEI